MVWRSVTLFTSGLDVPRVCPSYPSGPASVPVAWRTAAFLLDPSFRWALLALSRSPNEPGDGALAPHFRFLEVGGGDSSVQSGAQFFGCLQRQLDPSPRPGFEASVDEVERDDVAQRRMARVVIGQMVDK